MDNERVNIFFLNKIIWTVIIHKEMKKKNK